MQKYSPIKLNSLARDPARIPMRFEQFSSSLEVHGYITYNQHSCLNKKKSYLTNQSTRSLTNQRTKAPLPDEWPRVGQTKASFLKCATGALFKPFIRHRFDLYRISDFSSSSAAVSRHGMELDGTVRYIHWTQNIVISLQAKGYKQTHIRRHT